MRLSLPTILTLPKRPFVAERLIAVARALTLQQLWQLLAMPEASDEIRRLFTMVTAFPVVIK